MSHRGQKRMTFEDHLRAHYRQWFDSRQAAIASLRQDAARLAVLASDYPRASDRAEDLLRRSDLATTQVGQLERLLHDERPLGYAPGEIWGTNTGPVAEEGRAR